MKILTCIILLFLTSNLEKFDKCEAIKECLNLFMKDNRSADYLHTEIKDRIPFQFLTLENCEIKNSNYILKHVERLEKNNRGKARKISEVRIDKFRKIKDIIEMDLYYPVEGSGANCRFNIENDKIVLEEIIIYEN